MRTTLVLLGLIFTLPALIYFSVYFKIRSNIIKKHGRLMWEVWNPIQVKNEKIRQMIPFLRLDMTPVMFTHSGIPVQMREDNGTV